MISFSNKLILKVVYRVKISLRVFWCDGDNNCNDDDVNCNGDNRDISSGGGGGDIGGDGSQ